MQLPSPASAPPWFRVPHQGKNPGYGSGLDWYHRTNDIVFQIFLSKLVVSPNLVLFHEQQKILLQYSTLYFSYPLMCRFIYFPYLPFPCLSNKHSIPVLNYKSDIKQSKRILTILSTSVLGCICERLPFNMLQLYCIIPTSLVFGFIWQAGWIHITHLLFTLQIHINMPIHIIYDEI